MLNHLIDHTEPKGVIGEVLDTILQFLPVFGDLHPLLGRDAHPLTLDRSELLLKQTCLGNFSLDILKDLCHRSLAIDLKYHLYVVGVEGGVSYRTPSVTELQDTQGSRTAFTEGDSV